MKIPYNVMMVNFSEIDAKAIEVYCAIHGIDKSKNLGDITKINPFELEFINFLFGGSPCQSFSTAGKSDGSKWTCNECGHAFDPLELENLDEPECPHCKSKDIKKSESSLIVYWLNIFKHTRPKVAMFENVANLASKRFKTSFDLFKGKIEGLGYNIYTNVMNAKDYGIPQSRKRVICLIIRNDVDNGKFKFPEIVTDGKSVCDLLDDCSDLFIGTDKRIVIDETITPYIREHIESEADAIVVSDKGIYRPACTSGWNDHQVGIKYAPALRASNPITIVLQTVDTPDGKKYAIRRLKANEAYRFMGFDDADYEKASKLCGKTAIYHQAGNSIVVDVIYLVLKQLFVAMPYLFEDVRTLSLFSGIGAFEKALGKVVDEANEHAFKGGDLLE